MSNEINNDIKEKLIKPACERLVSKDLHDYNFEKPMYPTCIFYLGKTSELYMQEMNNDLNRGWGDSASHIKHYRISDPENVMESMTDFNNNKITVDVIRKEVTELMSMHDVFLDMNYICVYAILETTNINPNDFKKWYLFLYEIQKALPISMRTILMVILNQSLAYLDSSEKIRESLLELYDDSEIGGPKEHIYDSVFLFSNRLRNGGFINLNYDSEDYADYNLFADLILLTDTNSSNTSERIAKLYNKTVPAISASYAHLSKPTWEIAMITLKRCLSIIKEALGESRNNNIDRDIISKVLNISNGSMPVIDEFYNTNIQPKINSGLPAIDYLPTKKDCKLLNYNVADNETQGCLSAFVQINFLDTSKKIINENKTQLVNQIKNHIIKRLTLPQQRSFHYYSANIEEEVYNLLSLRSPIDVSRINTVDAIKLIAKKKTIEYFAPLVVTALKEIKESSGISIKLFENIYLSVNKMTAGSNDGLFQRVHEFYEDIVNLYYADNSRIESITKRIVSNCQSQEDVFNELNTELNSIFSNYPIFGMSFVDELAERMKSKGDSFNIGSLIASELLQDIDKKLALYSYNVYPSHYYEAYFLNTSIETENSPVTVLAERANAINIPISFQNTLNNERIETIWFYQCSEDNIRA